jgi:HD-GYP domain-containing protein (c-di-GMP phosphodiesterase class II)
MKYRLLHTTTWSPATIEAALAAEQVERVVLSEPADYKMDGLPTVFLLDPEGRKRIPAAVLDSLRESGAAIVALGEPGEEDVPTDLPVDLLSGFIKAPAPPRALLVALRSAYREAAARREAALARREIATRTKEVAELAEIGIKLTTEKNYNTLLDLILFQARRITHSDAGSLYLVEMDDEQGVRRLRFKLTQNDSRPDIPFVEFTMPINHTSLAGYAAAEGEALVFNDVYLLPPDVAYSFNRSFDERYGYRTKSMLVIPMQNHSGEVIGVVQLINRKQDLGVKLETPADTDRYVQPFSPHLVKLVRSLSGQAAVALENSQLYAEIERLFEGFVRAAVTAIEQRDPTTSGHSERVANLTVGLARVVDRVDQGPYRVVRFSQDQIREIRYAGLLHDFGKVGVREKVLVKEFKLYPADLTLIRQRHAFLLRSAQWEYEKARARYLEQHGTTGYGDFMAQLDAQFARERAALERFLELVHESNKPTLLAEGNFEALKEFAERNYEAIDGTTLPYLTSDEIRYLSIRRGTLDELERVEIESHVNHTFDFLRDIPWTRDLSRVPDIAHGHHEKLDGSGYPRKVKAAEIPVQTRMMTLSDIFDALTAKDRPYKRAVPTERALDIMSTEVKGGMLDPELFTMFVEARVFEESESPASAEPGGRLSAPSIQEVPKRLSQG